MLLKCISLKMFVYFVWSFLQELQGIHIADCCSAVPSKFLYEWNKVQSNGLSMSLELIILLNLWKQSLIMPYACAGTLSVMLYLTARARLTQRELNYCSLSKPSHVVTSDPCKTSDKPATSTFTSHGAPDGDNTVPRAYIQPSFTVHIKSQW